MKNTFHLRSYEPYGKKRLQRYTASSFPNRIIDFLYSFYWQERLQAASNRYNEIVTKCLPILTSFFFYFVFVLLLSWLDLRLAFITDFFSLACFDNNDPVTHTHKRICKMRPFHPFWSNFNLTNNKSLWPCTYEKPISIA